MSDRSDLIVKYFGYLINEYYFRIERKIYAPQTMGNAVVTFKSPEIGIEIVVDRSQVLISLGNQSDPIEHWFEFSDIIKYYAPSVEKVYIFTEKTTDNTWDEVIETQLQRLAIILRQYCEPLLKGAPLMIEEIKKIEEERRTEMLKKIGQGPAN